MFKKGDIVRTKTLDEILEIEDIWGIDEIDSPCIVPDMVKYLGKTGVVTYASKYGSYYSVDVDGDAWNFKPEWIESKMLTLKDFEKEVMDLGFKVSKEFGSYVVRDNDGVVVTIIPLGHRGCVDTYWDGFSRIEDWDVKKTNCWS